MIYAFLLDQSVFESCDRCSARALYTLTFGESIAPLVFCNHCATEVINRHLGYGLSDEVLNAADHGTTEITARCEPMEVLS